MRAFEKAREIKPRIDSLGDLYIHSYVLGRKEDTLKYCNDVLNSDFRTADYGELAAYLCFCIEKTPEHIKLMEEAIARNPHRFFHNIYRMIAMRSHRAIEAVDDKAEFERMIRRSNVDVARPKTIICPDDGEQTISFDDGVWISKPALGHGGQEVEIVAAPV